MTPNEQLHNSHSVKLDFQRPIFSSLIYIYILLKKFFSLQTVKTLDISGVK